MTELILWIEYKIIFFGLDFLVDEKEMYVLGVCLIELRLEAALVQDRELVSSDLTEWEALAKNKLVVDYFQKLCHSTSEL